MYEYNKLKFCPKCAGKLEFRKLEIDDPKRLVCVKCGYILYNNAHPAAAVIIEKDDKIVLIKRKIAPRVGDWALPSGFIEYEEKPEDAAVREAKEETGFNIKIKKLLGIYLVKKNVPANALGPTYYAQIVSGTAKAGSDVGDVKFFDPAKLPKNIAFVEHKEVIEEWRRRHKK